MSEAEAPHELFEGKKLPARTMSYVDDLKLLVFELRNLPEEVRRRFQSDMRIVVDYLAEGKDYRSEQKEYLPAIAIVNTSVTGSFRSYL